MFASFFFYSFFSFRRFLFYLSFLKKLFVLIKIKGPFFENENELVRLDPSDAKYVDVLHTNGGSIPK